MQDFNRITNALSKEKTQSSEKLIHWKTFGEITIFTQRSYFDILITKAASNGSSSENRSVTVSLKNHLFLIFL